MEAIRDLAGSKIKNYSPPSGNHESLDTLVLEGHRNPWGISHSAVQDTSQHMAALGLITAIYAQDKTKANISTF